jgi:hypothetical protein
LFKPELHSGWGKSKQKSILRKMKKIKKQAWKIFKEIDHNGNVDSDFKVDEVSVLSNQDLDREM